MPAETYAATGERFNHITRAHVAPTVLPAADASYPASQLTDGLPGIPFRFGSAAAAPYVIQDLNMIAGGDLIVWPLPTSSTNGAVITTTAGTFVTDSIGGKLSLGGTITVNLIARAGEKIALRSAISKEFNGGSITVEVYCVETGKYWNGTSWVASGATTVAEATTTTLVAVVADFFVEALSVTKSPLVTLRIQVSSKTLYAGFVDYLLAWPWTDLCAVFGTKYIDPAQALLFSSSTDNFVANSTSRATMVLNLPSFYAKVTPFEARYVQFSLSGPAPRFAPFIGELVFTQVHVFTASRKPVNPGRSPWKFRQMRSQGRMQGSAGNVFVIRTSSYDREEVEIPFEFRSQVQFDNWRNELRVRSEGGALPIVIVPNSGLPRVLFGMLDDRLAFDWTGASTDGTAGFYSAVLRVTELAALDAAL